MGIKEIKDCSNKQMLYLINDICDKSDKLIDHKQSFLSWWLQNDISGFEFAKIERQTFGELIISHCNNNKKLRGPAMALFGKLHRYDFSNAIPTIDDEKEKYAFLRDQDEV